MFSNALKIVVSFSLMLCFTQVHAQRCDAPKEYKRLADCPPGYRNIESAGCWSLTKKPLGVNRMECRKGETRRGHHCIKVVGGCPEIKSNNPRTTIKAGNQPDRSSVLIVPKVVPVNRVNKSDAVNISVNNVFIVDTTKKFCLGLDRSGLRSLMKAVPFTSEYIDVSSRTKFKCSRWNIARAPGTNAGERLHKLSVADEVLYITDEAQIVFYNTRDARNKGLRKRPGSAWYFVPGAQNGYKLFTNGVGNLSQKVLGISQKGTLEFVRERYSEVLLERGKPPAINETYLYEAVSNREYRVTIKQPVSVAPVISSNNNPPPSVAPVPPSHDPVSPTHDPVPPRYLTQAERLEKAGRAYAAGNYGTSFIMYKHLAEEGLLDAQFYLAFAYEKGLGTPVDYHSAYDWYFLAAQQGDAEAHVRIAIIYYEGYGTAPDYGLAEEWAEKAYKILFDHRNDNVQVLLNYYFAKMFEYGHGKPQNYQSALNYYEYVTANDPSNQYQAYIDVERVRRILNNE